MPVTNKTTAEYQRMPYAELFTLREKTLFDAEAYERRNLFQYADNAFAEADKMTRALKRLDAQLLKEGTYLQEMVRLNAGEPLKGSA